MAVGVAETYKAVFERTGQKRLADNRTRTETVKIEDPESDEMKDLAERGERGSLTITNATTGKQVHSYSTSAVAAQATMRSCISKSYNPFPAVKKGQV